MIDISKIDYSALDRFSKLLFHPRPELNITPIPAAATEDVDISVDNNVVLGARFHLAKKTDANILYFHGNGEIVEDYNEAGKLYTSIGVNFLPVDYRGYGRSTGVPTITAMMRDAHIVFDYVRNWLAKNCYTGALIVMGRSLGSAPVLELMSNYKDTMDGAIIESGFAYTGSLLKNVNLKMESIGFTEEEGFRNIDKIRSFDRPTLIIHAENDQILPFTDGQALYDASPAKDKRLLRILNAGHSDIFMRGMQEYMKTIKEFAGKVNKQD